MSFRVHRSIAGLLVATCLGCATAKQSDTARTGLEQLLISTAVDRSLNQVDLAPVRYAKVYLDTQYLDCVDKNYVIVSMHHRLLANGSTLVGKAEDADVVVEVGSGAVGTDRNDLFLGIPQIPLPPPSPISVPKMALFERTKAMGTAKLLVIAYDVRTKQPVINGDYLLARSNHNNLSVMGGGSLVRGDVADEIRYRTGQSENGLDLPNIARTQPQQQQQQVQMVAMASPVGQPMAPAAGGMPVQGAAPAMQQMPQQMAPQGAVPQAPAQQPRAMQPFPY
ncbi:MAG TPA: DUF6655 family protein [Pirellulales bacterium]|jgi:hypothetical protein|nr:DUF6655 family protein [Pirellulales bacterium]